MALRLRQLPDGDLMASVRVPAAVVAKVIVRLTSVVRERGAGSFTEDQRVR